MVFWIVFGSLALAYSVGYFIEMRNFFRAPLNYRVFRTLHAFCIAIIWPVTWIENYLLQLKEQKEWKEMLRRYYPLVYKREYGADPREE